MVAMVIHRSFWLLPSFKDFVACELRAAFSGFSGSTALVLPPMLSASGCAALVGVRPINLGRGKEPRKDFMRLLLRRVWRQTKLLEWSKGDRHEAQSWQRVASPLEMRTQIDNVDLKAARRAFTSTSTHGRLVLLGAVVSPAVYGKMKSISTKCPWCPPTNGELLNMSLGRVGVSPRLPLDLSWRMAWPTHDMSRAQHLSLLQWLAVGTCAGDAPCVEVRWWLATFLWCWRNFKSVSIVVLTSSRPTLYYLLAFWLRLSRTGEGRCSWLGSLFQPYSH